MASSDVGLKLMMITCLLLVCMVASAPKKAKALNFSVCSDVRNVLRSCSDYFNDGGSVPAPCCTAVKWLYNLPTNWGRQSFCTCIQQFTIWRPKIANNVRQLPKECGLINLPYEFTPSLDCNKYECLCVSPFTYVFFLLYIYMHHEDYVSRDEIKNLTLNGSPSMRVHLRNHAINFNHLINILTLFLTCWLKLTHH
jgi:hypothetical protein